MKVTKIICLISVVLALTACASNTQTIRYYSFNLNGFQQTVDTETSSRISIIVDPILLADFLDQDNLVMQLGANEVYKANYHRWAEPLDQAVSKYLVQKINDKIGNEYHFVKSNRMYNRIKKSNLHLNLEIDQFHSTDNAEVVLSGHYYFYDKDKSYESIKHFNVTEPLTTDGYQHSVEKLNGLLDQLIIQLIDSLETHKGKR